MGQVNRGPSFDQVMNQRARDRGRRDSRLADRLAPHDNRSEDEPVGMPPSAPQNWPRVFPGL
jgi:hypothetical protein